MCLCVSVCVQQLLQSQSSTTGLFTMITGTTDVVTSHILSSCSRRHWYFSRLSCPNILMVLSLGIVTSIIIVEVCPTLTSQFPVQPWYRCSYASCLLVYIQWIYSQMGFPVYILYIIEIRECGFVYMIEIWKMSLMSPPMVVYVTTQTSYNFLYSTFKLFVLRRKDLHSC